MSMKLIEKIINITNKYKTVLKELKKPPLTTLYHYDIEFKTVDGETHRFSKMCYGDPLELINEDLCKTYLILNNDFLEDNNGIKYPMTNIVSIRPILTDTVENVIKVLDYHFGEKYYKVWYQLNEIEIWKVEDNINETN